VLNDHASYQVPEAISGPSTLFRSASGAVACRPGADGRLRKPAPATIAAPFDQKKLPLRIRGSTDGLQFDRNRDTAFAGVDKAAISFKDDEVAAKDTTKATIIVGVAIPVIQNVLEFVPYVGLSLDSSKKEGAPREVSDDTWRAGLLADFRTHGRGISHLFLLRSELARNRKEKSEVLSANFTYMPLINGWLNDAINITSRNRSLFSIIPRADLRFNWGDFIAQGSRAAEDSRDFVRLGGQIGVTLTSDLKWLPVELTVAETYLAALNGGLDDLSQLKAVFSLYFDEKKYFGIDLGYVRGRREDLSKRERAWTFGFGAKF
jgi:hypothetical protein